MVDTATLIERLRTDGFVMVPGFFPEETVAQAEKDLRAACERDAAERERQKITEAHWEGPAGHTCLTEPSHLLIDYYGRCETLDQMAERIFTDPVSAAIIEKLAGGKIKLRGYNVRCMTGAYDPAPAHEWHRDSLGEVTIGILLTDVEPGEHGATAFIRGSHLFPYDPRWNALVSTVAYRGLSFFHKYAPFGQRLAKWLEPRMTGGSGKRGTLYFFINDTWHGREPNLHGSKGMVVLIGGFPTEYPFPDKVPMPSQEVIDRLPPALATAVRQDQPGNPPAQTILKDFIAARQQERFGDRFHLARMERIVADRVTTVVRAVRTHVTETARTVVDIVKDRVPVIDTAAGKASAKAHIANVVRKVTWYGMYPVRVGRRVEAVVTQSIALRGWRGALQHFMQKIVARISGRTELAQLPETTEPNPR